ncbi:Sulfotransferase 1E1 [Halotydeus destructor]|nr:Sulfotransferase 1E1 [Halotydeus destructor]
MLKANRYSILSTSNKYLKAFRPFSTDSGELNQSDIRKIKSYKRFFAYGLFGSTLLGALYLKKKKQRRLDELFSQTVRFPDKFGQLSLFKYKSYCIAEPVLLTVDKIQKFKFREDDIVLTSFPKTGTTWLQEIVYLIQSDLNYEQASQKTIHERFPFLEFPTPGMATIEKMAPPRLIKTHLPPSLLFEGLHGEREGEKEEGGREAASGGSFDEFFSRFIKDEVPYAPLVRHFAEVSNLATDPKWREHVLLVKYEDLKQNFAKEVNRISLFLGKEKLTEGDMSKLEQHCTFEAMEANPAVNYRHWDDLAIRDPKESKFMRKGIVGDWKTHFSPEQEKTFNAWLETSRASLEPL